VLIVTTPNGLFGVDTETSETRLLCGGVFFGITRYKDYIVVSEDILNRSSVCTKSKIRVLNNSFRDVYPPYFCKLVQIHQIAVHDEKLFVTETAKDNIHCIFLEDKFKTSTVIHPVSRKKPRHPNMHGLNAILVKDDDLYIGLNKTPKNKPSAVAKINISDIYYNKPITNLKYEHLNCDIEHSHDLQPYEDDILISASNQGFVYSFNEKKSLFTTSRRFWTRGLAVTEEGIWVGYSVRAVRNRRFTIRKACSVNLYRHGDFKLMKSIILRVGQVRDIIYIPKEELNII